MNKVYGKFCIYDSIWLNSVTESKNQQRRSCIFMDQPNPLSPKLSPVAAKEHTPSELQEHKNA